MVNRANYGVAQQPSGFGEELNCLLWLFGPHHAGGLNVSAEGVDRE